MGCLLIYHPDILEFLESKSWDEGKLTHFNLSVLVDDEFMKAVENDSDIFLRYPCMDEKGLLIKDETKWETKTKINARYLWDLIMKKAYDTGEYGVLFYDNMNNDNNLKYMETIVTTNPCGEYLSGVVYNDKEVLNDYFGACNLGSVFLHKFVLNPFTKDAKVDYPSLKRAIRTGVKILDNVVDVNKFPLKQYENYQKNIRTIGLGITGLADMLTMLNMKYGSKESIKFVDELMDIVAFTAYDESCNLAITRGAFNLLDKEKFIQSEFIQKHVKKNPKWLEICEKIKKHGIRNGRILSVAPTGTLSLAYGNNCSSGLEPIFSLEYDRKIKIGGQDENNIQIYKMRDYAYEQWLNTPSDINIVSKDIFVTAMDLDVEAHLNILKIIAFHTDMSCSKTINIPTDYPFEKTKEVYMDCWKNGVKGCTIFRPNPLRQGILISEKEETKEEVIEETTELKRGDWEEIPEDTCYYKRKIYTGCGKLNLFIGYSPSKNKIVEMYIKKSAKGGCIHNIDALVIAMSGMYRLGGELENIERAFTGCGSCPSFVKTRMSGEKISAGMSCPTAILNMLKEFEREVCKKKGVTPSKKMPIDLEFKAPVKVKNKEEIFSTKEKEFLKKYGETSFVEKFMKCPLCAKEISIVGGCKTCSSCGYSKCD